MPEPTPEQLTPGQQYQREASGRLAELIQRAFADHPELEVENFFARNIDNWSARIPGRIQTEADTIHAELQVESHLVGWTDDPKPEPIFEDRVELVVTGLRKGQKSIDTRHDGAIARFLARRDPDLWHRRERLDQLQADILAAELMQSQLE